VRRCFRDNGGVTDAVFHAAGVRNSGAIDAACGIGWWREDDLVFTGAPGVTPPTPATTAQLFEDAFGL
jgi:hypothetical protein